MIEIFKTNVESLSQAELIMSLLRQHVPAVEVNFDLEDCDNILRVKGETFCCKNIVKILAANGFESCLLE